MRQKACAPGVVRKQPLTFCLTFIIRKSRSARFVKGYRKVFHKGERFGMILRQAVQQILAFVLFLAPPLTTRWRRVVVLFCQASRHDSHVALCVGSHLGRGQCRLRLGFGAIHPPF